MKTVMVLVVCLACAGVGCDGSRSQDDPSITDLSSFASDLVDKLNDGQPTTAPNSDTKTHTYASLLSTDVQRTDSVIHPRVGVVTLSMREHVNSGNIVFWQRERIYELRFGRDRGKWKLVGGTEKVVKDTIIPPSRTYVSTAGTERPAGTHTFAAAIEAAQR